MSLILFAYEKDNSNIPVVRVGVIHYPVSHSIFFSLLLHLENHCAPLQTKNGILSAFELSFIAMISSLWKRHAACKYLSVALLCSAEKRKKMLIFHDSHTVHRCLCNRFSFSVPQSLVCVTSTAQLYNEWERYLDHLTASEHCQFLFIQGADLFSCIL